MLTQIELTDFQCHKSLTLNLGKITTLVGPSDSGKSAIIRALDWAIFNNGKKALLIRRGAKTASITITVDAHTVTRTTKDNSYVVDGTELSAIGRSVPVDVPNIFRMSEDNIQRQHEYLFWFSATGSELTRNFNRVVDLSRLDEWVRIGTEKEKEFKQDVRYCDKRLEELQANELSLLPYEQLEQEARNLSGFYDAITQENDFLTALVAICDSLRESAVALDRWQGIRTALSSLLNLDNEIRRDKELINLCQTEQSYSASLVRMRDYGRNLSGLLSGCREIFDAKERLITVGRFVSQFRENAKSLDMLKGVYSSANVPFDELFSYRSVLGDLYDITGVLRKEIPDISSTRHALEDVWGASVLMQSLTLLTEAAKTFKADLSSIRAEYSRVSEEFHSRSGNLCPLCGQQMGDHRHG